MKHLLSCVVFLFLIPTLVQCESYQSTYFLDYANKNPNLTCKDILHPCRNPDQIIHAANIELSNNFQNSTLDSFTMIIIAQNSFTGCSSIPFDFSNYTLQFNLIISGENFNPCEALILRESIIHEFTMAGASIDIKFELDVRRGIETVIIDRLETQDNFNTIYFEMSITNLHIRNSVIVGAIFDGIISNLNITNSEIYGDLPIKSKIVEISDSYIFGSIELENFERFSIRNSIWKTSYLSKFTFGSSVYIYNTTIDSPSVFMAIYDINLDRINIINTNYGNYMYQMIKVTQLSILRSTFFNNTIPSSKSLMALQFIFHFTLEDCVYSFNRGGFLLVTDVYSNAGLIYYYLLNSKIYNNQLEGSSVFEILGSGEYAIDVSFLDCFNNTSVNSGSCFRVINGYVNINNSRFDSNRAIDGGSIHASLTNNYAFISCHNSIFSKNNANFGGAIYVADTINRVVQIQNIICESNVANIAGGCIYSEFRLDIGDQSQVINNSALSYGKDIAYPLQEIIIKDSTEKLLENNRIYMYAGETVLWSVYILDTINQSASFVNQLTFNVENSNDATLSQSIRKGDHLILLDFQIFPKTDSKSVAISLSVSPQLTKTVQVEILPCPFSYSLTRSGNGYSCVYVPLSIIIPTAILGLISLLIILGFTSYSIKFIVRKLLKLRKQEKAEYQIEEKFKNKDFIFETESSPLISSSINSTEKKNQYTIPISEIDIIKKIGEGGMGVVYHARWNRTDIAIKKLKAQADDEEFEKESILMSSLRHPSIVSCYGVSLTSTAKYIVVEYMENGSLEKTIYDSTQGRNILKFHTKLKILIDVAKGMTYLHTIKPHKIIHRDLKSANVLLDHNMNAKVGDFGLSKVVSGVSTMTCNVGTLFYCSPEVLSNQQHQGQSTKLDVYSFSVLMWELLFEMTPFSNELTDFSNSFSILMKVIKGHRPTLLFGSQFENVTQDWIQHNFTKKQIETIEREKIIEILRKFVNLMEQCWSSDPSQRPEFIHITDALENLLEQMK